MNFKREIPVASGVYRPLKTKRYIVTTMGGFWPVVQKLPDGRLGVVTRDGDFHIGERGRLTWLTSPDGGESWSHASVISDEGPDNRNPAFGVAPDGTLVATFIKADRYESGQYERSFDILTPLYMCRSENGGETWTRPEVVDWLGPGQSAVGSPFGRMITLANGDMLMGIQATGLPTKAYVIRSRDNGRTWIHPTLIADKLNEFSICNLGDDRLLVVARVDDGQALWQTESDDGGYTWSEPYAIPGIGPQEHPPDVIKLSDGRLLMTYGRRVPPYGVQGIVSVDDGKTWDIANKLFLVADGGNRDCGYPSSVQRDDGTIVTVYYAWDIVDDPRMGVHAAAIHYRPEDL